MFGESFSTSLLLHLPWLPRQEADSFQESEDSSCSRLESADVQLTPNRTFEPLVCEASVPEQLLGYKDREGLGAEERGRDRMAPSSTVGHRSALLTLFVLLSWAVPG